MLERKLELNDEAAKTASASTPVVKAGPKGFSIASADNANIVKLRGVLHFDGRRFFDDATPETADTWILRRVRPTLEGTFNGIFDFRFTPDFAGGRTVVQDAFVAARLKPWAVVTAGKFKVPVGLERLVSASDLRFIERGLPTSLVPNRDLGVQLGGDFAGGAVNYSVGYFNGVTDGGSSGCDRRRCRDRHGGRLGARVFLPAVHQFRQLRPARPGIRRRGHVRRCRRHCDEHAAAGLSHAGPADVLQLSRPTPRDRHDAREQRDVRGRRAAAPRAAGLLLRRQLRRARRVRAGRAGRLARDADGGHALRDADNTAWQVQLSWFATGEDEAFRGFTPGIVFSPGNGTWGAWEFVARYHELDVDDDAFTGGANSFANPLTAASKASAWGVGVNWYLNAELQVVAQLRRDELRRRRRDRRSARRASALHALCVTSDTKAQFHEEFLYNDIHDVFAAGLRRPCSDWRSSQRPRSPPTSPAQRVVRPDARALRRVQQGIRASTGKRKPAKTCRSSNRMADRASRRAR